MASSRLPLGAGVVFMAMASLHLATAWVGGPARNWHGQTSEYYQLLADAFGAGQTSLLVKPAPEMLALPDPYDPEANANYRLHDASLYRGKYYLYFGPTPALVLFLPVRLLTGLALPSRAAVGLFCDFGFACSCLLLFLLARNEKWEMPEWLGAAAVLSMATVPGVAFLLIRPSFYEVAISGAYCFSMAGFLLTAWAEARPLRLAAAGLCFGLAAGCRPDAALIAVVMTAIAGLRFRRQPGSALAFAAPVAFCGVALAAYNYARFGSPFEFGIKYILLANRADFQEHFGNALATVLPSIYGLLAAPTNLQPLAPSMGILRFAPIAILGLAAPAVLPMVRRSGTRLAIAGMYLSAIGVLILLAFMGFVLGRYTVDFAPPLVCLAWCGAAAIRQRLQGRPRLWRAPFGLAVVAATLYTAVLDFSFCVTRVPR